MPTVSEHLQQVLLMIVRSGTTRCTWCEGTKVIKREWNDEAQGMVDYDPPRPCAHCDGRGIDVPAPDSLYVVGTMSATLLNLVIEARQIEQYGRVQELLDWSQLYLAQHMPQTEAEIVEALTQTKVRLDDADSAIAAARGTPTPEQQTATGALSEQELQELLGDAQPGAELVVDEKGRHP